MEKERTAEKDLSTVVMAQGFMNMAIHRYQTK